MPLSTTQAKKTRKAVFDIPRHAPPRLAFPALIAANATLACGPWLVRLADTGPVAAGFWRLALALPLLMVFAARAGAPAARPGKRALGLIVVGSLFFSADLASWHAGILYTKLANAALLGNFSSLILPLAGIVLTRIWPTRLQWLAFALALAGALMLMGSSYELSRTHLAGDLLCLLAGTLYTGYLIAMQSARRTLPSWWTLAFSTAISAPALLAIAFLLGERILPGNWTPLVVLAITSQLVGQGLLIYAVGYFSPLIVGLSLLLQPAVAALIGWLAFGELLSTADMGGMFLIAMALVMVRLPNRKPPPQAGPGALECAP